MKALHLASQLPLTCAQATELRGRVGVPYVPIFGVVGRGEVVFLDGRRLKNSARPGDTRIHHLFIHYKLP